MKMNRAQLFPILGVVLIVAATSGARAKPAAQVLIEARIVEVTTPTDMRMMNGNKIQGLHLFGITAPGPGEPMGTEALQFTRKLLGDGEVKVSVVGSATGPTVYGNIMLSDGSSLVAELLKEGLASWNHLQSADVELGALEIKARAQRKGIWLSEIPVLGGQFKNAGGSQGSQTPGRSSDPQLDAITADIMELSDGDKARLGQRLFEIIPMPVQGGAVGQTTLTIREGRPIFLEPPVRPNSSGGNPASQPTGGGGVYLDSSGSMFHRASCFKGGPTGEGMSRSDAMARGAAPCPKCRP